MTINSAESHEARIQKLETITTGVSVQLAAQAVEVKALRNETKIAHNSILEKLSDLSESLKNTNLKDDKLAERFGKIELSHLLGDKIKKRLWAFLLSVLSGGGCLIIERFINHH